MTWYLVLMLLLAVLLLAAPAGAWQQKEFIVTFWCPPPATDECLANVAKEGYNLTWAPADALDTVAKHGLKALLQDPLLSPASVDSPEQAAKLDALIKRVKGHPALEGYFITDEPGSGAFAGLGKLVAFIRERDPKSLSYINLFPTYASREQLGVSADAAERRKVGLPSNYMGADTSADTIAAYNEHLALYLETVKPDLISYDHYHFMKNGDGAQYFLNLELIREAAQKAKLPFLNIIQACTIDPPWRLPTASELRFLVYTTLAYGGRGISYFTYWGPASYGGLYQDGKKAPLADDAATLNHELKILGPTMMTLEGTAVYHTDPLPIGGRAVAADSPVKIDGPGEFVLGLFKLNRRIDAFMIVNRDYRKRAVARLLVAGTLGLQELDRKTGKWTPYCLVRPGRPVTVELKPADGRMFLITPP